MSKIIDTDVLIIGSGLAGLLAAIKLLESGADVVLACKTGLAESNSRYAQGGIAAAAPAEGVAKNTSSSTTIIPGGVAPIQAHLADTIKAGAGLVDEKVAQEIIGNGWRLIEELTHYGVVFDHLPDGSYSLAREGGHSAARVYHHQDVTGTWICNALIAHLKSFNSLRILEHTFASDLLMKGDICAGSLLVTEKETMTVAAKHTILATGGMGQVYNRTTNPVIATGDGIAMAYRAGAELIDMEFVQFHPTALHLSDGSDRPTVLISEAVRGAGALLLDHNKQRFMQYFDPAGELATRDIVARSMCEVMKETGKEEVFLDLRPIGKKTLQEHFPNILQQLSQHGINALEQLVPVSPAAHYFMGGISAVSTGKTSIRSLYAVGECASTGLHGANRLASNSLLEAGVMALNVAELIANIKSIDCATSATSFPPLIVPSSLSAMRRLMFASAGVVRSGKSLEGAIASLNKDVIQADRSIVALESANLLLIAKLIAASALRRCESRGAHYRLDYPQMMEKFAARQIVYRDVGASVRAEAPTYKPVPSDEIGKYKWIGNKDLCPSVS